MTANDVNWPEQAQSMMQSWMDAQKTMWDAWAGMAWGGPANTPPFSDVSDQWQKLAAESLRASTAMADPVVRTTAEQFLAAQGMLLRFVEFAAHAWQSAAPRLPPGADWQDAMLQSMEQLRRGWTQAAEDAAATSKDMKELTRLYRAQWQAFGQPWEALARGTPALAGRAASGESAAVFEFSTAYREAYQQTLGRLVESPGLGMSRESAVKFREGFDAWVEWHLANAEYQAVLADVWDAAFKRFGGDLADLAEKGGKVESVRELVLLWSRGAEQVFTEVFRTERYTLAQGKLLNATMRYRLCQRAILESFLEMYDIPTRSELDEAHRRFYELRKEVKALKKQLAGLSAAPDARGEKGE